MLFNLVKYGSKSFFSCISFYFFNLMITRYRRLIDLINNKIKKDINVWKIEKLQWIILSETIIFLQLCNYNLIYTFENTFEKLTSSIFPIILFLDALKLL